MRVLIELFDRDSVENVIATCAFEPDIVIFLCDSSDPGFFKESAVYRLLRHRELRTEPRFYYVDSTDVREVQRTINAVVRDYPGCVFDFSGGRDLMLALAGAHSQKFGVPAFYIDPRDQRFVDVQKCAHLKEKYHVPSFSAEDFFAMSGATIQGNGHFRQEKIDGHFSEDILAVWEIIRFNIRAWSAFVSWLQVECAGTAPGQLRVENVRNRSNHNAILRQLQQLGILGSAPGKKGKSASLLFQSALHKKCLLNQGIWLEMFCFVQAQRTGYFGDVRTSVVVDWDGVEGGKDNTKNEIDVLLVKGATPVFVSCKMGLPSALALSEIRLLSNKFGGSMSRAVLLTAGVFQEENRALQTRARDLGVYLIDRSMANEDALGPELIRIAEDTTYCIL